MRPGKEAAWALRGRIIKGHQRGGTQLGCPTANIQVDRKAIAALRSVSGGVYCGWASLEDVSECRGSVFPMVLSIGPNVHFKDQEFCVEVHILHKFSSDFYGAMMRVVAVERLREMQSYNSLDELKAAIANDMARGRVLVLSDYAVWQRADYFTQDMKGCEVPLAACPVRGPLSLSHL